MLHYTFRSGKFAPNVDNSVLRVAEEEIVALGYCTNVRIILITFLNLFFSKNGTGS